MQLLASPGKPHLGQIVLEWRQECRVGSNCGSQQGQRTVDAEIRFLIERCEPQTARLGALRAKLPRLSPEREE